MILNYPKNVYLWIKLLELHYTKLNAYDLFKLTVTPHFSPESGADTSLFKKSYLQFD